MAISLVKGQKISLVKESGGASLAKISMGLGWDAAKRKPKGIIGAIFGGKQPDSIDLDASCVLFDADKNMVDAVWFRQLKSKDGSIRHTGDNLTGDGDGDDESIIVDLDKVPANVQALVFTVNSFRGQTFQEVDNAFCRLVNLSDNQEIARYTLTGGGNYTGYIMAKVYRHHGEWKMAALGEPSDGQTFNDMLPQITATL
ncbi:MAG: TerD family protein [Planctomycetaceae bacterium]|jgi:tellurium resistance protein TerZ|nr:TerD family protein [Planctomycetaceae bacterium]